jgi:hypothetical protein
MPARARSTPCRPARKVKESSRLMPESATLLRPGAPCRAGGGWVDMRRDHRRHQARGAPRCVAFTDRSEPEPTATLPDPPPDAGKVGAKRAWALKASVAAVVVIMMGVLADDRPAAGRRAPPRLRRVPGTSGGVGSVRPGEAGGDQKDLVIRPRARLTTKGDRLPGGANVWENMPRPDTAGSGGLWGCRRIVDGIPPRVSANPGPR